MKLQHRSVWARSANRLRPDSSDEVRLPPLATSAGPGHGAWPCPARRASVALARGHDPTPRTRRARRTAPPARASAVSQGAEGTGTRTRRFRNAGAAPRRLAHVAPRSRLQAPCPRRDAAREAGARHTGVAARQACARDRTRRRHRSSCGPYTGSRLRDLRGQGSGSVLIRKAGRRV